MPHLFIHACTEKHLFPLFPCDIEVLNWACLGRSPGEGNGTPLQYSCLENPRDGRAWWAAVYGVEQSRTRLKRLSSSSSNRKISVQERIFVSGRLAAPQGYADLSLARCRQLAFIPPTLTGELAFPGLIESDWPTSEWRSLSELHFPGS